MAITKTTKIVLSIKVYNRGKLIAWHQTYTCVDKNSQSKPPNSYPCKPTYLQIYYQIAVRGFGGCFRALLVYEVADFGNKTTRN